MRPIVLVILLVLLSGCATADWNRAMGTTYYAICPICKSDIGVYDTTSNFQCIHCKNVISASQAIALYNQFKDIQPDYVICPSCNTKHDLRFLNNPSIQTLNCSYCRKDFERAEGKRLHVQMITQLRNALLPALINAETQQAIAQEQANRDFADKMQSIYTESAARQQQNIQAYQQNIANWNVNWQKSHNQIGTKTNPLHVTVDEN